MEKSYKDERFPKLELRNNGSTTFQVFENSTFVSTWETCEDLSKKTISESFAQRRADGYFDRLAEIESSTLAAPTVSSKVAAKEIADRLLA